MARGGGAELCIGSVNPFDDSNSAFEPDVFHGRVYLVILNVPRVMLLLSHQCGAMINSRFSDMLRVRADVPRMPLLVIMLWTGYVASQR